MLNSLKKKLRGKRGKDENQQRNIPANYPPVPQQQPWGNPPTGHPYQPQGGYVNPGYQPQSGHVNPGYQPYSTYANPGHQPQGGYASPGNQHQSGFANPGYPPQAPTSFSTFSQTHPAPQIPQASQNHPTSASAPQEPQAPHINIGAPSDQAQQAQHETKEEFESCLPWNKAMNERIAARKQQQANPEAHLQQVLNNLLGAIMASTENDLNVRHRDSPTAPGWYNQAPLEFERGAPGFLCHTCRRIDIMSCIQNLSKDMEIGLRDYIFLGSIGQISTKRDCELCKLVITAIQFTIKTNLPPGTPQEDVSRLVQETFDSRMEELIYLTPFRYDDTTAQLYLVTAPPDGTPESPSSTIMDAPLTSRPPRTMGIQLMMGEYRGMGREIQTDRIDFDWIKGRIRLCEASMFYMRVNHKTLVRAIDVKQGCVVDLRDGDRYVTLSYVWGKSNQLKLTRETEVSLRRPNGVFEMGDRIPKTIRDAIALVREIGEQYIWVDALCIRQDDDMDKADQIGNMGNVYKESIITIVAACGKDATYGLPGVDPGSRNAEQAICKVLAPILPGQIAEFGIATTLPDDEILQNTEWKTRAWTMQEKALARKTLYITDWGVILHCRHGLNIEDRHCWHPDPPQPEQHNDSRMYWWDDHHPLVTARIPNFSNFDSYAFIVSDYTRRNLTFQGDAYNAITGVFQRLVHQFWVPFIHGIPPAEIEAALLWSPIGSSVRRINNETREPLFPSWSWLGWIGHAAYPWMIERQFPMSCTNSPLMIYGRSPDTGGTVLVDVHLYRMPSNFMSWTPDPEDDWLYIRPDADDSDSRYYRPLAFDRVGRDLWKECILSSNPHVLHLKTLVATFNLSPIVYQRKTKYDYSHDVFQMRILDQQGYGVGYIDVPDPETMSQEQLQLYSGRFEFAVISRCALGPKPRNHPEEVGVQFGRQVPPLLAPRDDDPQFWHDEALFDLRIYDGTPGWRMWNVMMLTEVGTMKERAAVGRIHVDAFSRAMPAENNFLLK